MFENCVRIILKEHLADCHVEGRNHLLRISHKLTVEVRVKLFQVKTIDVEEWLANNADLLKAIQQRSPLSCALISISVTPDFRLDVVFVCFYFVLVFISKGARQST